VAAAAKLKRHLRNVKAWHSAQPNLDVPILTFDKDGRNIGGGGADEKIS